MKFDIAVFNLTYLLQDLLITLNTVFWSSTLEVSRSKSKSTEKRGKP